MIADIFITTKGRSGIFERSLKSFAESTTFNQYRLTIIDDTGRLGYISDTQAIWAELLHSGSLNLHSVIEHKENMGLGPSINEALSNIDTLNRWYEDPIAGDTSKVAPFVVYCQDDLIYTPGWLEKMAKLFMLYENGGSGNPQLGFASGLECVEHPTRKKLGPDLLLKDWIRAANMFARREYWMSMFPIPRFDPETRNVRAKPNDGIGSGVDWHFVRNHKNSVCNTNRTCLVIPGLVKHIGYKKSTWLDRELPESDSDKKVIG